MRISDWSSDVCSSDLGIMMGDTAENLAREYQITREEVDAYAAESFDRAVKAKDAGYFAGEIAPVTSEEFALAGYNSRGKIGRASCRERVCPSDSIPLVAGSLRKKIKKHVHKKH